MKWFSLRLSHLIAGLGMLGLAGMLVVGGIYFTSKAKQDIYALAAARASATGDLMNRLSVEFLNARRAEKDFLLRNDEKYVSRHEELSRTIGETLSTLKQRLSADKQGVLLAMAETIATGFQEYSKTFIALAETKRALGLDQNSGLEGTLRASVHAIESRLRSFADPRLDAAMLTMRRHEKDFMLRREAKYGQALQKSAADFAKAVEAENLSSAERSQIGSLLEAYTRDFATWMKTAQEAARLQKVMSDVFASVEPTIVEVRAAIEKVSAEAVAANAASSASASEFVRLTIIGMLLAVAFAAFFIGRAISRPIARMTSTMRALASGDVAVNIVGLGRKDEIGEMAAAMETFKLNAIEKTRVEAAAEAQRASAEREREAHEAEKAEETRQAQATIAVLGDGLGRLAQGDLLCRIEAPFVPNFEKLRIDFNAAVDKLKETILAVVSGTRTINSGTQEISTASDDLSRRTEQQAASLEETAAALDQITATVKKAAEGAEHAREVVAGAKDGRPEERRGGAQGGRGDGRHREVLAADQPDHRRHRRDRLPDQPAGAQRRRRGGARRRRRPRLRGGRLRSARAGAALGRGGQGDQGPDLDLDRARSSRAWSWWRRPASRWSVIVGQVAEINAVVADIAAGATEQATGLQQVNTAVNQMDQVTQQNAAMVEQSTAASQSLSQESAELSNLVSMFKVGDSGAAEPLRRPVAKRVPVNPGAQAPQRQLKTSAGRYGSAMRKPEPAADRETWKDF